MRLFEYLNEEKRLEAVGMSIFIPIIVVFVPRVHQFRNADIETGLKMNRLHQTWKLRPSQRLLRAMAIYPSPYLQIYQLANLFYGKHDTLSLRFIHTWRQMSTAGQCHFRKNSSPQELVRYQ